MLCLELGFPHPDYLLPLLSSKQYGDWEAFYRVSPFGDRRADRRAAGIMSMVANRHRGPKEKPYQVESFMPFEPQREQTEEEKSQQLKAAFSSLKG